MPILTTYHHHHQSLFLLCHIWQGLAPSRPPLPACRSGPIFPTPPSHLDGFIPPQSLTCLLAQDIINLALALLCHCGPRHDVEEDQVAMHSMQCKPAGMGIHFSESGTHGFFNSPGGFPDKLYASLAPRGKSYNLQGSSPLYNIFAVHPGRDVRHALRHAFQSLKA